MSRSSKDEEVQESMLKNNHTEDKSARGLFQKVFKFISIVYFYINFEFQF
jgi:hypothetical protein